MRQLIGINGKIKSGKSTTADIFIEKGFKELSFAKNLKEMCKHVFGLTDYQVYTQEGKEELFPHPVVMTQDHITKLVDWIVLINKTNITTPMYRDIKDVALNKILTSSRHILQFVGTEVCRNCIRPSFHLDVLGYEMAEYDKAIISDARFENEINFIGEMGGKLIKVINPNQESNNSQHESEIDLPNELFDTIIYNDKTKGLDVLRQKVEEVYEVFYS